MISTKTRVEKQEGSIGDSFASLAGETKTLFPQRYLELKRKLLGDEANRKALVAAWGRLTARLIELADRIDETKQHARRTSAPIPSTVTSNHDEQTIPEATYDELVNKPSDELLSRIRNCGSVVIHDVVSEQQATKWLDDVREYIKLNPQVKGFPEDDKQVYEIYWSKAQQEARSHPRMLETQRALLSIFTAPSNSQISLTTPLTYSDRLRIRSPGDARFALGPHMDGGSIERWEDPTYRQVYEKILQGRWEEFDAWRMDHRADAVHDLYPGPGSTGLFRSWQGWTSLSATGPTEGTLLVYPFIREHSAYLLMRPLFRSKKPREEFATRSAFLAPENWEIDLKTSDFPGSPPGRGQELSDVTHPHLELARTMVAVPRVRPGSSVWWHSDVIHAVESQHCGTDAAAVFYIPAVALTLKNAEYIRDQRETLLSGRPAPDFPGGVGESEFQGRGTGEDILTVGGKEGAGLIPFGLEGNMSETDRLTRQAANAILGF